MPACNRNTQSHHSGGAFAMGAVGGTIWHSIKGARNSPRVSCRSYAAGGIVAADGFHATCSLGRQMDWRYIGSESKSTCTWRECTPTPILASPAVARSIADLNFPGFHSVWSVGRNVLVSLSRSMSLHSISCLFLHRTFDCAVKGYRQKEDPWNAIISGFLTGGCLAARGGY
jgi:hypothetical protein